MSQSIESQRSAAKRGRVVLLGVVAMALLHAPSALPSSGAELVLPTSCISSPATKAGAPVAATTAWLAAGCTSDGDCALGTVCEPTSETCDPASRQCVEGCRFEERGCGDERTCEEIECVTCPCPDLCV